MYPLKETLINVCLQTSHWSCAFGLGELARQLVKVTVSIQCIDVYRWKNPRLKLLSCGRLYEVYRWPGHFPWLTNHMGWTDVGEDVSRFYSADAPLPPLSMPGQVLLGVVGLESGPALSRQPVGFRRASWLTSTCPPQSPEWAEVQGRGRHLAGACV